MKVGLAVRSSVAPGAGDAPGVVSGLTVATEQMVRVLPVHSALSELFPFGGLRRGSTVTVRGSVSLLLALLGESTAIGSWAAVVGMPDLGVLAAAELGVTTDRLALVPRPGAQLVDVVAALLDGFDLVVVPGTGRGLGEAQARKLSARARHRKAVLLAFGSWPGAEVELRVERARWHGLGEGHGVLRARELTLSAHGRRMPVRARVSLPGVNGRVDGHPDSVHETKGVRGA